MNAATADPRRNLARIAEALDCPVESFYDGGDVLPDLAQTSELLRLWGSLKTDSSRQAVLKLVRAIVANE